MTTVKPEQSMQGNPNDDILGCSGDLSDAIVAVLNAYPTPLGCLAPQQMLSGQASIEVMRALDVCYQNWKRKWKVELNKGNTRVSLFDADILHGRDLLSKHLSPLIWRKASWSMMVTDDVVSAANAMQVERMKNDCMVWRSKVIHDIHISDKHVIDHTLPQLAKYLSGLHIPGFRQVIEDIVIFADNFDHRICLVTVKWVKSKAKRHLHSKPDLKENP
jgi:hypothetical protein